MVDVEGGLLWIGVMSSGFESLQSQSDAERLRSVVSERTFSKGTELKSVMPVV